MPTPSKKRRKIIAIAWETISIRTGYPTNFANKLSEKTEQYTLDVIQIHQLDFIVLMTMDGIRLTHPDKTKIGKHFEGGDEKSALKEESISPSATEHWADRYAALSQSMPMKNKSVSSL